jgi:DNA-binding Lrp family transcriptional regulator
LSIKSPPPLSAIPFVGATTGANNLVATVLLRDTQHLYEYLTSRLASLPGVRSVESAPIIGTLKRSAALRPGRPG